MRDPRVCLIILDGVGAGPAPDAAAYGDSGANTFEHTWERNGGIAIPNLSRLGIGAIFPHLAPPPPPSGAFGTMIERSAGKDTTIGHWEIAGLLTENPFPTFPRGFPPELIDRFEKRAGIKCLGNIAASGTEIIKEFGPLHQVSGSPIVYTSADSVFQIAAHTDVVPLVELYGICLAAREVLVGPWAISRVIARPFTGEPGNYVRTDQRRDYSIPPHGLTILDLLAENGKEVVGIGKIEDIFSGRGLTRSIHTHDNEDGVRKIIQELRQLPSGLIFANLVDFDMKYGHRRDVAGFAKALEEFDLALPAIMDAMKDGDSLIITADHGNDPTYRGTDHTREVVPLLGFGRGFAPGCNLGVRTSFADVAATIAKLFSIGSTGRGEAFSC